MRPQKGKILSWVIFAILIVAAFGVLIYLQKQKVQEVPTEEVPTEVTKEKPTEPGKKFAVPELTERDKQRADSTAFSKALQMGGGCEDIKFDEVAKQKCEDTLLYGSALEKNSEQMCKQIHDEDLRTRCLDSIYSSLAIKTLDSEFCNQITNPDIKQNCLDRIKASFGRTAKSAQDCEGIENEDLKQGCLDDFYFSDSVGNLSLESCNNILNAKLKDRCTQTVAKNIEVMEIAATHSARTYKSTEEKLQECETDECKDEANYNLALVKKDLSYCNIISDAKKQEHCIKTQTININSYYLRQATSRKDPSLCSKILDDSLRTTCLTYSQ